MKLVDSKGLKYRS